MSKRSIDLVSPPRTKKKVYERVANLSLNASLNLSAQPVQPVEHRVAQRVAQPVAQRVTQPVQRVVVAQPVQPRPAFKIIGLARSFLKSCSSDVTCYSPELLSWTLEEGQLKGIWTIDGAQGSTHQMVVKAPSAGIRSLVDIRAHCSCDYSSVYAVYCKHIRLCLEQLLDPDCEKVSHRVQNNMLFVVRSRAV
jgi:hypothetical protein